MKKIALVIGLAACFAIPAHADPVRVFNLPLGGKLDRKLPKCSQTAKPNSDFCWIDEPVGPTTKHKLVTVGQPDDSLPEWVAAGLARIGINRDGEVDSITVSLNLDNEKEAISSISQRFGWPTDKLRTPQGVRSTIWRRPELQIAIICDYTKCFSEFLSPSAVAERSAAWDNRKRRPATP
jgi:hypothetical protein